MGWSTVLRCPGMLKVAWNTEPVLFSDFSIFWHRSLVSWVRHWLLLVIFVSVIQRMVMSSNRKSLVQCSLQLVLELCSRQQLVLDCQFWKELRSHLSHQPSPYWQVQIMNVFIRLKMNQKKIFGNLECKFFKAVLSLHPLFKWKVIYAPYQPVNFI